MEKYINASQLVSEILEVQALYEPKEKYVDEFEAGVSAGARNTCDALLDFVNDFTFEPVGLEREAVQFCFDNGINVTPRDATAIANYFYILGLQEMRKRLSESEYNKEVIEQMRNEQPETKK